MENTKLFVFLMALAVICIVLGGLMPAVSMHLFSMAGVCVFFAFVTMSG